MSGGQTGVDRAVLDVAMDLAPLRRLMPGRAKGRRRCGPGPIIRSRSRPRAATAPAPSRMCSAPTARSFSNRDALTGGSAFTAEVAHAHHKPYCAVNPSAAAAADPSDARIWRCHPEGRSACQW